MSNMNIQYLFRKLKPWTSSMTSITFPYRSRHYPQFFSKFPSYNPRNRSSRVSSQPDFPLIAKLNSRESPRKRFLAPPPPARRALTKCARQVYSRKYQPKTRQDEVVRWKKNRASESKVRSQRSDKSWWLSKTSAGFTSGETWSSTAAPRDIVESSSCWY